MKKSFPGVRMLFFAICLAVSFGFVGGAEAEDDFQYWSWYSLKYLDTKYVELAHYGDFRFRGDAGELGLWYVSERLKVDPVKYLSLGINYTYLENKTASVISGKQELQYQHRLELEVNPYWQWRDVVKIKTRNRVEFRWLEDKGSDHGRFRHRTELEFPLTQIPKLKSIYTNNELFWDFNKEIFNEDRWVPLGLNWKLHQKVTFSIFYMVQWQRSGSDWRSNQILGTNIALSL